MAMAFSGNGAAETQPASDISVQHHTLRRSNGEANSANGRGADEPLFRFTDRLFRARSLADICEAALDAIREALGCERASVLIFDDAHVMRFVAWRNLSNGYRRAVEGHTPWTKGTKDPQPICVEDIDTAELAEALRVTVKAEGIGACAFIPLVARGQLIGKFMTYYDAPHAFSRAEIDLAITIARQLGFGIERMRADEALRESKERLAAELDATRQLQNISTQLIYENDTEALYEMILDAAVIIMRSDFASMQMFHPERGELQLLAHRGFDPSSVVLWQWVRPGAGCICGAALHRGERAIVSDVECCDFMAGTASLAAYREAGMRSMQSTPLVSRTGRLLGMISTHWSKIHQSSERDLRLLDVLARQAADLVERRQTELVDQRLAAIVGSTHDSILSLDLNGIITTWNHGAERLFGYTAADVIGKSITVVIPTDRHNEEPEILERIKRGERVDHYETIRLRKDGTLVDISLSVSPIKDASGNVVGASRIGRDITERKQAQKRQELLTQEIHHRTKNIFSVVQAVVSRSFADKRTVKEAEQAVLSRLHSLAQTHVMLIDKDWQGAEMAEVVLREMSPYAGRCTMEGPTIVLNAKAAQNFALAVHELATNAVKYGALSNQFGRVHISWSVRKPNGHYQFQFQWQEHGGPRVSPPSRKGFGSTVLEQVMSEYFETPPQIEFAADGIRYEVIGSLDSIAAQTH